MKQQCSYVYILASQKNGTLYIGVTSHLVQRIWQHKKKLFGGFTARYGVDQLVYYEQYDDITTAILREKRLKSWCRDWKIRLIEEHNLIWKDLYPDIASI